MKDEMPKQKSEVRSQKSEVKRDQAIGYCLLALGKNNLSESGPMEKIKD
ncbi:hypothetical protein [Herpetosiphon sp. NSE202]